MHSVALSEAYRAAREHAALIMRGHGLIVISGKDRASYLQGLLTNDVAALRAGQGCYAAYLTAQGRMITDLHVYELGDVMLLTLPRDVKDAVLARLDQFIFSEDVQLGDVTATFAAVAVVGPAWPRVVAAVTGVDAVRLSALPEHGNLRHEVSDTAFIVLRVLDTGEPGCELIVPVQQFPSMMDALRAAGAVDADETTAEVLRIEAGIPRFGADMNSETIPLEAGIEHQAISFSKGCYVGQEVIIRVLHRGHGRVARKLVGIVLDAGHPPARPGTQLLADGKDIGAVTSSVLSPALGRSIALGYVKRDFAVPGTRLSTADGVDAQIVAVPFRTT